ncbi:MAG: substrate-binding domain-containing protein [Synergistales bacterium]|nr:substrate-binding domain-containing protein [Synergistales bacterium]
MRGMRKGFIVAAVFCLAILTAIPASAAEKLIVFHAGSLSAPMKAIEDRFEKANPGIDVLREAGGSASMARKIIDLDGECDCYFSADYMVIERLLRPEYADWNAMFASNELALMYGPQSKYADEVDSDNWYEILMRDDVTWGHSNPDADPCGYRALMVLQLAEDYYDRPDLHEEAMAHPGRGVRPKAIELIAQVDTGAMDYAFEYKSVAVQHGLPYVTFPPEINLSDPAYADLYSTAEVERAGREPGETIITKGQPIVYGCTIPTTAPHPDLASRFMQFVLSPDHGLAVFESMGQGIVGPERVHGEDNVPQSLEGLVQ